MKLGSHLVLSKNGSHVFANSHVDRGAPYIASLILIIVPRPMDQAHLLSNPQDNCFGTTRVWELVAARADLFFNLLAFEFLDYEIAIG
jgi:hypothetical protein